MVYKYFQVAIQMQDGREAVLEWSRVRCFDKEIATMFLLQIKELKEAL